jgi:predicted component of type VI protein secretion system
LRQRRATPGQLSQLQQLQEENALLRHQVSELQLDNAILRDVARLLEKSSGN